MFTAIMIILGILGLVSNANGWFIVPSVCIYICFGIAAFSILHGVIMSHWTKKKFEDWGL